MISNATDPRINQSFDRLSTSTQEAIYHLATITISGNTALIIYDCDTGMTSCDGIEELMELALAFYNGAGCDWLIIFDHEVVLRVAKVPNEDGWSVLDCARSDWR